MRPTQRASSPFIDFLHDSIAQAMPFSGELLQSEISLVAKPLDHIQHVDLHILLVDLAVGDVFVQPLNQSVGAHHRISRQESELLKETDRWVTLHAATVLGAAISPP